MAKRVVTFNTPKFNPDNIPLTEVFQELGVPFELGLHLFCANCRVHKFNEIGSCSKGIKVFHKVRHDPTTWEVTPGMKNTIKFAWLMMNPYMKSQVLNQIRLIKKKEEDKEKYDTFLQVRWISSTGHQCEILDPQCTYELRFHNHTLTISRRLWEEGSSLDDMIYEPLCKITGLIGQDISIDTNRCSEQIPKEYRKLFLPTIKELLTLKRQWWEQYSMMQQTNKEIALAEKKKVERMLCKGII